MGEARIGKNELEEIRDRFNATTGCEDEGILMAMYSVVKDNGEFVIGGESLLSKADIIKVIEKIAEAFGLTTADIMDALLVMDVDKKEGIEK